MQRCSFSGNLKVEDVASLEIDDPFTKELIEIWCLLNFKHNPSSFSHMSIWYNSLIRINGEPIFYKRWFVAGVNFVSNLLDETSSRFLTFEDFKKKYPVKVNFLEYHSLVTAVSSVKHISACSQMQNTKSLLGSKDFKLAYTFFIERHASPPQSSHSKWISDFH